MMHYNKMYQAGCVLIVYAAWAPGGCPDMYFKKFPYDNGKDAISDYSFIFFLSTILMLCGLHAIKLHWVRNSMKSYQQIIRDRKIATVAVTILGLVEYVALIGMYWSVKPFYPFFVTSHCLIIFFYTKFRMSEPDTYQYAWGIGWIETVAFILAILVAGFRTSVTGQKSELYHIVYMLTLPHLFKECYTLFAYSSDYSFDKEISGQKWLISINGVKKIKYSYQDRDLEDIEVGYDSKPIEEKTRF